MNTPSALPSINFRNPIQEGLRNLVRTLPTDVHARREVLNAAIVGMEPRDIPKTLRTLLGDLDRHLMGQREFEADLARELAGARSTEGGS